MMDDQHHQTAVWVADNPMSDRARFHLFPAWDHIEGRNHRHAWSLQLAMTSRPDVLVTGATDGDLKAQLYSVRHKRNVNDEGTLPDQDIREGDVLVLLPNEDEIWQQLLEAHLIRFPERIPINIRRFKEPPTLAELDTVLQEFRYPEVSEKVQQLALDTEDLSEEDFVRKIKELDDTTLADLRYPLGYDPHPKKSSHKAILINRELTAREKKRERTLQYASIVIAAISALVAFGSLIVALNAGGA